MQTLYYRRDMVGCLARQILQPSRTIYVYERNKTGYKTRAERTLPVRLSLRRLARRRLLTVVAMLCAGAWLLGYHPLLGVLLPGLFFFFDLIVHAIRE